MTNDPAAAETLARIERMLHELIGLDPSTVGSSLVHRAVYRRMASTGEVAADAYAMRIGRDAAELQELVELVVIPETYFFREPEALEAVAQRVKDDLARNAGTPVRILSAPCSSGEEPYSIAMRLLSTGIPAGAFAIDAIDVSRDALRKANAALYGRGSFRGGQEWRPYFDERPQGFSLHTAVKKCVRFVQANLLDPQFRAPAERYDFVFCRNLLIYFDIATQARVLATLRSLLAPRGILVVGAADTFAVRRANFVPVPGAERSFLFEYRTEVPIVTAAPPRARPRAKVPRRVPPARSPLPAPRSMAQVAAPTAAASRSAVSELANAGRLHEAITLGESLLPTADAELLTIMGTTHAAMHSDAQAETCYRRALYLEPHNAEALLHLALLLEARNDTAGALRLRLRARRGRDESGSGS